MKRWALVLLALGMVVVGLVWTFQGLGYLEGSAMSGQDVWAVVGPAVAGPRRRPADRGDAPAAVSPSGWFRGSGLAA